MSDTQPSRRSVSQMIRIVAQSKGVRQDIIEKDYALSYLLAAIAGTEAMGDHLVLKGGSALKKVYFENYRFSEDLDYSTQVIGPLREADGLMQAVIRQMNLTLNERGPFQVSFEPLILPQTHPGGQKAYIVRVQYPDQRQPLCRLKVEITTDEPITEPVEVRPVLHEFPEEFHAIVPVYTLTEIAAEKLRALLQSRERLQGRGWGASRVCRDYYNLWYLLQQPVVNTADLIPLIREKCAVRNVSFATSHDFISEDLLDVARSEWAQQLLPFVPDAPPAVDLLTQVQFLILSVLK